MNAEVGILLPVYNGVQYLAEAVESVRNQSLASWELLLGDDISTDHSLELARSLAAQDARIQVFSNDRNLRIPGNINKLFGHTRARYLCILSQDDLLRADFLKTLVRAGDETRAALTMCDFEEIDAQGRIRRSAHIDSWRTFIFRSDYTVLPAAEMLNEIYRRRSLPFSITSLIRRDAFENARGYDERFPYCCDANFHLELLALGNSICFSSQRNFLYRRHEQMATEREGRARMAEELHYVLARHFPRARKVISLPRTRTAARVFGSAWKRLVTATLKCSYPVAEYWRELVKATAGMLGTRPPAGGTLTARS